MGYVSDRTQIVHAQGSHRAKYKNLDIIVEPWRVANVSRYQYVAIPKKEFAEKAAVAVAIAVQIANNDNYIYRSSTNRWEAYKNIESYMKIRQCSLQEAIAACGGGWDCSSLLTACLHWAGILTGVWQTYTGGLLTVFRKSGAFDIYNSTEYLSTDKYAKTGSVYWKADAHCVMSVNSYEDEPTVKPVPSLIPDDRSEYIEIVHGSYYIRSQGSTAGAKLGVARKGEIYSVVGRADSGWYQIDMGNGKIGYISNRTSDIVLHKMEEPAPLPSTDRVMVEIVDGSMWIRSKASTLGKKIAVAQAGDKYYVLGISENNWCRIQYASEQYAECWISHNTKHTRLLNID